MMVLVVVFVGGLSFTPKVAEDSTLAASGPGTNIEPTFRVSKFRDEIKLHGHTISIAHENQLVSEAEFSFPGFTIGSNFEPLGTVPPYWEQASIQLIHVLTAADSGTAELDKKQLTLDVVATDDLSWTTNLQTLASELPHDIVVHDDSISVSGSDLDSLCRDAANGFSLGPINFRKSTNKFRSSAYPRLERLAALADACRTTTVRITGHTDSSGEATWNDVLSLRRAEAVAAYLTSKGIAADRIKAIGAGSEEPIASNDSRYGRGLNRRIEVEFTAN